MVVRERCDLRPIFLFSYLCEFISPLLIGLSKLLKLPKTPQIVGAGLLMAGVGRGLGVSFSFKEAK